jgi:hypothetical protein
MAARFMSTRCRERRHRGLARRLVAVRWRAIFVLAVGQRVWSFDGFGTFRW